MPRCSDYKHTTVTTILFCNTTTIYSSSIYRFFTKYLLKVSIYLHTVAFIFYYIKNQNILYSCVAHTCALTALQNISLINKQLRY